MKQKLRWRVGDWREQATATVQRLWYCEVRRVHRIKMQSNGHCVRCGRRVR